MATPANGCDALWAGGLGGGCCGNGGADVAVVCDKAGDTERAGANCDPPTVYEAPELTEGEMERDRVGADDSAKPDAPVAVAMAGTTPVAVAGAGGVLPHT